MTMFNLSTIQNTMSSFPQLVHFRVCHGDLGIFIELMQKFIIILIQKKTSQTFFLANLLCFLHSFQQAMLPLPPLLLHIVIITKVCNSKGAQLVQNSEGYMRRYQNWFLCKGEQTISGSPSKPPPPPPPKKIIITLWNIPGI